MISVYYSIAHVYATSSIVSATKILLAPSVSSGGYVFNTRNLQTAKEESSSQQ